MYSYVTADNLQNPQYYMYTKYRGVEFLKNYLALRMERIRTLYFQNDKMSVSHLIGYFENQIDKDNEKETLLKEPCLAQVPSNVSSWFAWWQSASRKDTERIMIGLAWITLTLKSEPVEEWLYELLSIFTKKFEVFKHLRALYGDSFKYIEGHNDLVNPAVYVYFSLAVLEFYKRNLNLKFLNVAIKLNDLICSIENRFKGHELKMMIRHCLETETECVKDLMSRKGVVV